MTARERRDDKRRTASQVQVGAAVGVLDGVLIRVTDAGDDPQLGRNPDIVELALGPALDLSA